MPDERLRVGAAADVAEVRACVRASYRKYVPRMGKEPGPMLADFEGQVAAGQVTVLEAAGRMLGLIVMFPNPTTSSWRTWRYGPANRARATADACSCTRRTKRGVSVFARSGSTPKSAWPRTSHCTRLSGTRSLSVGRSRATVGCISESGWHDGQHARNGAFAEADDPKGTMTRGGGRRARTSPGVLARGARSKERCESAPRACARSSA